MEGKKFQIVKAGQQISFENGVIYGTGNILGYDKVRKEFIINEDQAKIVRFIYKSFLEGNGCTTIKYQLEKKGYVTSTGLKKWNASYVNRVLQNLFYCGTIVYRKSYIPDYLDRSQKEIVVKLNKLQQKGNINQLYQRKTLIKFRRCQMKSLQRYI